MEQTNNGIVAREGWSWGAFMLNAWFLVSIKRYQYLWWYLLLLIPLVNFIFIIAYAIYLGVKGHALAAASSQFANQSEHDGYMKATDHAGKIMFYVFVVIAVVCLIGTIVLVATGAFMGNHMMQSNDYPMGPMQGGGSMPMGN